MLGNPLERILSLKRCDRIYKTLSDKSDSLEFVREVLSGLDIEVRVTDAEKALIPETGPGIVVANHPFGAIEGVILAELLLSIRPDVKVMANFLLERIPQMKELFIAVDPFNRKQSVRSNIRPMREAVKWVRDGHLLVMFPAGEVSHIKVSRREISDPSWNPGIAKIVSKATAPVMPVFFKGANSAFFQLAGLMHPRLRTAMLPRELLNKRQKCISLKIGNPIPYNRLSRFESDRDMVDYLRWRTYLLGHAVTPKRPAVIRLVKSAYRTLKPVSPPQPWQVLEREVNRLSIEQQLTLSGDHEVWEAHAQQIPNLLREIGRLRELTFREANEGTGNPLDLDGFDTRYHHIFIWNRKAREIVGAYRVGCTDLILSCFGTGGLYTSTLFRSSRRFYDRIGPALELGRSFIRAEYQRSYAPLLLLWKGIGQFILKRPQYRMLFGPVSISRDYSDLSRQLIASTLLRHSEAKALAAMIRPKTPPKMKPIRLPGSGHTFTQRFCNDIQEVCSVIADIEFEVKSIPILLKHYLNLGGQLLSFNIDKKFGSSMDGFILVDLLQSNPKTLRRYFGKEGLEKFYRYHETRETAETEQFAACLAKTG